MIFFLFLELDFCSFLVTAQIDTLCILYVLLVLALYLRITCAGPYARFSKVPEVFGLILGDIILFVSLKRRHLEARNFAVILIIIPFTTYEKTSFAE